MYDTIIIGAGMSGLAAGIRLAYYDYRVCILERHSAVGGLNSYYGRGGRVFDVGLHALTNFAPKGVRGPLARMLRQLRFALEEFSLVPQVGSAICFPGITLKFNNDYALFESEVVRQFPAQADNFRRMVAALASYDDFGNEKSVGSARAFVTSYINDPLLVEMIFCPALFYGSATEHDMTFGAFSIIFRSIFLEGLARPITGVRLLLKQLLTKFRNLGGELRLRTSVQRIVSNKGKVEGVVLADGTELAARNVVSSAGWPETIRLCGEEVAKSRPVGGISICEAIAVLDQAPANLGVDRTIVFFNDSEKFHFERPNEPVDPRSGVACSPNNFAYPEPLRDNMVRVSALANYDRWAGMDEETYQREKALWADRIMASAERFVPEFRKAMIDKDFFTPATIQRFTAHDRGAIYGSTEKRFDGTTHLENLFLCGNDQGLVGIIGAIISGINIVNRYLLKTT